MKIRNKKTGRTVTLWNNSDGSFPDTIKELAEEWEDYEEPKEYWYIESDGTVDSYESHLFPSEERYKQIGNYFETKEEAEQTVEKLKAWKRLKDKGFRFVGHSSTADGVHTIEYTFDGNIPVEPLDLLFGGEE